MKKLMTMVAATMAFAAFADEPAAPAPEARDRAVSVEKHSRRPNRPPMMMGQGAMDPLFRAVMNPRIADQIGLSEDQKAKLAALKGCKNSNAELQAKVREGTERQVKLLEAEKIDEAAVMRAIDEVFEARKEMAKAQTKRVIEVRSILTPEQAAKALEEMKSARGGRHQRMEGPKGRGPHGMGPKDGGPKCEGGDEARRCEGAECATCEGPECKAVPSK